MDDQIFDKYKFAQILKKAQGPRTQKEFSSDAGVSIAYLSKLYNGHYDTPPKVSTIKKISSVASNVSLKTLLEAAGYSYDAVIVGDDESDLKHKINNDLQVVIRLINYFASSSFRWNLSLDMNEDLMMVSLDGPISDWYFDFSFLHKIDDTKKIDDIINEQYGVLAQKLLPPYLKYTYITNDPSYFNALISSNPIKLDLLISVLLINGSTGEFESEIYLETAYHSDDVILDRYALPGII